jgi:hypothetical protein
MSIEELVKGFDPVENFMDRRVFYQVTKLRLSKEDVNDNYSHREHFASSSDSNDSDLGGGHQAGKSCKVRDKENTAENTKRNSKDLSSSDEEEYGTSALLIN